MSQSESSRDVPAALEPNSTSSRSGGCARATCTHDCSGTSTRRTIDPGATRPLGCVHAITGGTVWLTAGEGGSRTWCVVVVFERTF